MAGYARLLGKAGKVVAQIGREAGTGNKPDLSTYHFKIEIDPALVIQEEKSYHDLPKYYDFGSEEEKEDILRNYLIQISREVRDIISSFH